MISSGWRSAAFLWLITAAAVPAAAQVQVRLGDSTRVTYSELHEGLRNGSPAADSVRLILGETAPDALWAVVRASVAGNRPWNDALLAFNRLAALRDPASGDSAARWRGRIEAGEVTAPPTLDPGDLLPGLHAIQLELDRGKRGDLAILRDLLPRIPAGEYDLGDAWVFGRLGQGAADSVARRFLETGNRNDRIRYLTLLSFSTDTALIPLLTRIYAAPDSFALPVRIGVRASDGLLWIGTRASAESLLAARARARSRGVYADPRLGHADLDFLGNDSSMAVSRSGRWLTEWLTILPAR